MNDEPLSAGKLDPLFLEELIGSLRQDERVIVGPKIGEDAAVVDFGKTCLVIKTDPITFTSENIGWYVVNINANDVACMGATPRWLLLTTLLPERKTSKKLVKDIFRQLICACEELGISLIGGHTEITPKVSCPILIGQMIGEVTKERLIKGSGARVGDVVLLTKGIAIEGTSVIYQEKKEELKEKLPDRIVGRIKNFLHNPGISVVKDALLASRSVRVHSMHDPTEGGLRTGLWELAHASKVGLRIDKHKIPILKETEMLCKLYGLDPLRLLASGALILTLPPEEAERLRQIYEQNDISCSIIGEVVPRKEGIKLIEEGKEYNLLFEYKDEISKIL